MLQKPAWNHRMFILIALFITFFFPGNSKADAPLISDPNLEAAVRMELNLAQQTLEETDLQKLTSLYPKDSSQKIESLEGLQHAVNLRSLIVPEHHIERLEPIRNLKHLEFLVLEGNNISDIKPLSNLVGVNRLVLFKNQIEDIKPLSGLTNLTDLLIHNNRIKDISALKELPLRWLDLSDNQIEDLSPLSEIPTLETLYVNNNRISDIDVLLQLPKLKSVYIANNPLDEKAAYAIKILGKKGVKVEASPNEPDPSKNEAIRVTLDASTVPFQSPPFILNETTFVQFRPIFERLGIEIQWDDSTRTIYGKKVGLQLQLQIDNPVARVNGKSVTMPAAPEMVDGHTFVPVRFISEAAGAQVEWDESRRNVVINSKRPFITKDGKISFTAYGLWEQLSTEIPDVQLAIRYFNYTNLYIFAESRSTPKLASMDFKQYWENVKYDFGPSEEWIIEEKQAQILGFDGMQLTFINKLDWDKRIDTLLAFEADSTYYIILYSSYEDTHKASSKQFEDIMKSMKFLPDK